MPYPFLSLRRTLIGAALLSAAAAQPAAASILVNVNEADQRMTVTVDGVQKYSWPVSTGGAGYGTPDGTFRPNRMDANHFSKEYDNAPMPHAIFFDDRGHAIHGSYERVGRPVSHGCVRLAPAHAAVLFSLVQKEGMGKTKVVISGHAPTITASRGRPPGLSQRPYRARIASAAAPRGLYSRTIRVQRPDEGWDERGSPLPLYPSDGYARGPVIFYAPSDDGW